MEEIKTEKMCPDCKKIKPLSEYGNRTTKSGTYKLTHCKACIVIRATKWREENRAKHNEYQRNYQKRLREVYKKYTKKRKNK